MEHMKYRTDKTVEARHKRIEKLEQAIKNNMPIEGNDVLNVIKQLEQENAELKAHCKKLYDALVFCDREHKDYYINVEIVQDTLNATPQQSLANIKADAIEKAITQVPAWAAYGEFGHLLVDTDLLDYANKLRDKEEE